MILDLSPIINNEGKKLKIEAELVLDGEYAGVSFKTPARLVGTVLNIGGSLELSADISLLGEFTCDRCLKTFERPINCLAQEVLKKEDFTNQDENPDAVYFKGNSIELDEIVLNNIILSLPIKNLCSEDCKGLCPSCGQNLNEGSCSCDAKGTDPRFDILDKFFE